MPIGGLIRDLRLSLGWSQSDLATQLCLVSGRPTVGREDVHRWETEKVIPGKYWLSHLATTLSVPLVTLLNEAKLSRMNRREFLSLTALTAVHRKLASELTASIASSDAGPLATVQTTHGTDLVIAALSDKASRRNLNRWMIDGDTPILRVNAAGILAKLPGQESAEQVATVLTGDLETRQLYTTAVIARVGALPWDVASEVAKGRLLSAQQAQFLAVRFAREALNPRDSGARWCSATMLRNLGHLLTLPADQYPESFQ
jgi:transcriptional regulator with XRE-family HTH domain